MAKDKGGASKPAPTGSEKSAQADVEHVVRRYYLLLHELEPDVAALDAIIGAKLEQVEHPNALSPRGQRRGKPQILADLSDGDIPSGGDMLTDQTFDVLDVLVDGSRAAVRGRWSGVLREAAGPLPAGTRLAANVAAFLRVKDGLVVEHESYECYEPIRQAV